jgi:hypothetical protein
VEGEGIDTQSDHKVPRLGQRISLDDWLFAGEVDQIARERLKLNGNGNHSAQQSFCDCDECRISGKRYALHRVPVDCDYSRARAGLVDQAVRNADKRVTVTHGGKIDTASNRWTQVFASEMDRLSEQLGL